MKQVKSSVEPLRESLLSATNATEPSASTIDAIKEKAKRLSILSMMSTTAAGSGHPTSCMSAAELAAGTFFYAMKFDPKIQILQTVIVSCFRRGTPRRCSTLRSRRLELFRNCEL